MKVLVIKRPLTLPDVGPEEMTAIKAAAGDAEVVVVDSEEEARPHLADAEVILGSLSRDDFLLAKNLRWMHAVSSGADSLLYPEMVASDVTLTGEKGLVGEHLADHAFALLLALARQIPAAVRGAPDVWPLRLPLRKEMVELHGLVAGIVGLGGTGRSVATRARAFGMEVIAVDSEPVDRPPEVARLDGMDRFHDLLTESDVVFVCCPLTPATRGMFNDTAFARMKSSAFIVNVTRGAIIDNEAIVKALQTGQIRGAGLDVTPIEPLPLDHPLWSLPNVLITPHTAGASQSRVRRNVQRFAANLRRYREGEALEGEIDKQKGF